MCKLIRDDQRTAKQKYSIRGDAELAYIITAVFNPEDVVIVRDHAFELTPEYLR